LTFLLTGTVRQFFLYQPGGQQEETDK